MIHLPILRAGRPYVSKRRAVVNDVRTAEPVVEVSLANGGLIARDLARAPDNRKVLEELSAKQLVDIAGERVIHGGNNVADGPVSDAGRITALDRVAAEGFAHQE